MFQYIPALGCHASCLQSTVVTTDGDSNLGLPLNNYMVAVAQNPYLQNENNSIISEDELISFF